MEERLEVNTLYYKYTMGTLVHLEVSFEILELSTTFTTILFTYTSYYPLNRRKT